MCFEQLIISTKPDASLLICSSKKVHVSVNVVFKIKTHVFLCSGLEMVPHSKFGGWVGERG